MTNEFPDILNDTESIMDDVPPNSLKAKGKATKQIPEYIVTEKKLPVVEERVSTVQSKGTPNKVKDFNNITMHLKINTHSWLKETVYMMQSKHNFNGANVSNLVSFLIDKAQKEGVNPNEYLSFVDAKREKRVAKK